jgi:hypothetical protein
MWQRPKRRVSDSFFFHFSLLLVCLTLCFVVCAATASEELKQGFMNLFSLDDKAAPKKGARVLLERKTSRLERTLEPRWRESVNNIPSDIATQCKAIQCVATRSVAFLRRSALNVDFAMCVCVCAQLLCVACEWCVAGRV